MAFASSVVFFHVSEFLLAGIFMRKDLSKRCEWLNDHAMFGMLMRIHRDPVIGCSCSVADHNSIQRGHALRMPRVLA